MAAFWDKIKSAVKDSDEKKDSVKKSQKEQDQKKQEQKPVSERVVAKSKETGKDEPQAAKTKESKKHGSKQKVRNEKEPKKGKAKEKKRNLSFIEARQVNGLQLKPKISEAAMNQQTLGKYVFLVSRSASKREIAEGIEALYGVTVEKVHTIHYKPKNHGFKGMSGTKTGYKKAIVSLKKGESLELFKESK